MGTNSFIRGLSPAPIRQNASATAPPPAEVGTIQNTLTCVSFISKASQMLDSQRQLLHRYVLLQGNEFKDSVLNHSIHHGVYSSSLKHPLQGGSWKINELSAHCRGGSWATSHSSSFSPGPMYNPPLCMTDHGSCGTQLLPPLLDCQTLGLGYKRWNCWGTSQLLIKR